MKLLCALLLIVLAVSDVWSLPARNSPQDDAEVIARPASGNTDFRDFVDTGAVHAFLQPSPSTFHFPGFSFEDIFRRLRPRFWPVLVDSSDAVAGSGDGDSSEAEPTLGFGLRLPTALNTQNGNTTSTVKVVNGHKVEINETTYGDSNSLFKLRLVNVRPLESGEEVAQGVTNSEGEFKPLNAPSTSAPPQRTNLPEESEEDETDRREPLQKQSKDNEVRDIDEPQSTSTTTTTTNTATLDSSSPIEDSIAEGTENRQQQTVNATMSDLMEDVKQQQVEQQLEVEEHTQQQEEQQLEIQQQEQEEEEEEQLQEEEEQQQLQELQQLTQDVDTMAHNEEAVTETETEMPLYDRDSLIENFANDDQTNFESSQLVERESQMQREREELESSDDEEPNFGSIEMSDTFNDEWSTLNAADPANDLDNSIDAFESYVPVDLSNDIAVNDAAAANPDYPRNPDAEEFELPASAIAAMSKFEKLSLKTPMPLLK